MDGREVANANHPTRETAMRAIDGERWRRKTKMVVDWWGEEETNTNERVCCMYSFSNVPARHYTALAYLGTARLGTAR